MADSEDRTVVERLKRLSQIDPAENPRSWPWNTPVRHSLTCRPQRRAGRRSWRDLGLT